MSEAVGEADVRARKEHTCFLCYYPITVGTVYRRWAWVDDGSVETMRAHKPCSKLALGEIEDWTNGEGLGPGEMREWVQDTYSPEDLRAKHPDVAEIFAANGHEWKWGGQ